MGMLFGTDGVRGIANKELTASLAMQIAKAAAAIMAHGKRPRIVLARDTRRSGDMLAGAVIAGLCSGGADVLDIGIAPTPAAAYLTGYMKADAGVVISASHNPAQYNGIKLLGRDGCKLPDATEQEIERCVLGSGIREGGTDVGCVVLELDAINAYEGHLLRAANGRFDGMHVALDCANGAAYAVAPQVLAALGVQVDTINCKPDGFNINDKCGATDLHMLQQFVREKQTVVGFALDGDADRLIAVDENGKVVDGDEILYICACYMKAKGKLPGDAIVGTIMSNMGLELSLAREGINLIRTNVGDRYVMEEMLRNSLALGGEQSGHIIFANHANTGDGLLTAIQLLNVMAETGKTLAQLRSGMIRLPQYSISATVPEKLKERVLADYEVEKAIACIRSGYEGRGRVVVRPSGTEPSIRIMLEGEDQEELKMHANQLKTLMETAAVRISE